MDLQLRGKVVLLTGATGGIGSVTAHAFAREGACLALQGRSADKLASLAAQVRAENAGAARGPLTIASDLEAVDGARIVVEAVLAGFSRIDVLVCCAGATRGGAFDALDDSAWRRNLELKLLATIRVLRAALPAMRAQKSGRIVLVVGNNGREPDPGMLPGAVANAGLLALTRGLARDIAADGLIINAVNPGPVHSQRWQLGMADEAARTGSSVAEREAPHLAKIPLGRLALPEEVARHIVFLASEAAGHMTGSAVTVDGGAARGIG